MSGGRANGNGSPGRRAPKRKPEEIRTGPVRPLDLSTEDWHEMEHGVNLFNAGKFWHAHEAWELVWQRQDRDERLFFQGLIQLAAAYHHLAKDRRTGFVNNLQKSAAILEVFAPEYLNVEVAPLLEAIRAGLDATAGDGPLPGGEARASLVPRMAFRLPYDPDLMAAVRSAVADEEFGAGVELFNDGYHWEAHERWEEAMRRAEGEAREFLGGFSQAAAGLNFLRGGKGDMAGYLFRKSVDSLKRFGNLRCGVEFEPLVRWMEDAVEVAGPGRAFARTSAEGPPRIAVNGTGGGGATA